MTVIDRAVEVGQIYAERFYTLVEVLSENEKAWVLDAKFGQPYPALRSSTEGIDRFLIAGTCVGIPANEVGPPRLYATHGVDDIYTGLLRPNPLIPVANFSAKARSYQARWPHLQIVDRHP